jgi:hypothetical protein
VFMISAYLNAGFVRGSKAKVIFVQRLFDFC